MQAVDNIVEMQTKSGKCARIHSKPFSYTFSLIIMSFQPNKWVEKKINKKRTYSRYVSDWNGWRSGFGTVKCSSNVCCCSWIGLKSKSNTHCAMMRETERWTLNRIESRAVEWLHWHLNQHLYATKTATSNIYLFWIDSSADRPLNVWNQQKRSQNDGAVRAFALKRSLKSGNFCWMNDWCYAMCVPTHCESLTIRLVFGSHFLSCIACIGINRPPYHQHAFKINSMRFLHGFGMSKGQNVYVNCTQCCVYIHILNANFSFFRCASLNENAIPFCGCVLLRKEEQTIWANE